MAFNTVEFARDQMRKALGGEMPKRNVKRVPVPKVMSKKEKDPFGNLLKEYLNDKKRQANTASETKYIDPVDDKMVWEAGGFGGYGGGYNQLTAKQLDKKGFGVF
jgi:hypothetical protein